MPSNELYIGNLDPDTRPQELRDVFDRYGSINRCEVKFGGSGKNGTLIWGKTVERVLFSLILFSLFSSVWFHWFRLERRRRGIIDKVIFELVVDCCRMVCKWRSFMVFSIWILSLFCFDSRNELLGLGSVGKWSADFVPPRMASMIRPGEKQSPPPPPLRLLLPQFLSFDPCSTIRTEQSLRRSPSSKRYRIKFKIHFVLFSFVLIGSFESQTFSL